MADQAIRRVPAMTQLGQLRAVELRPRQIQEHLPVGIHSASGYAGRIQECRASPVSEKGLPQSKSAPQSVMHMTKDNKISGSMRGDSIQCLRQILIPPVHCRCLPVASAGTGGLGSQA